uniref:Uncharacterized protein n=1 Tax=Candidatus Kentrum sp. DK TaxID=2126562 RepID=A0A450SCG2_9GAMM|nr:MAG: hypothetical protein BECKDK2373C_GA0170839_102725 [Candidatus Kentron sp. DK]
MDFHNCLPYDIVLYGDAMNRVSTIASWWVVTIFQDVRTGARLQGRNGVAGKARNPLDMLRGKPIPFQGNGN